MELLLTLAVSFPLERTVRYCYGYSGMGWQLRRKLVLGRKQIHVQACLEV